MSEGKIPSFLGLCLLITEIVIGILLIQNQRLSNLTLKNVSTPKDVRVSNISDTSLTISWITDKKTKGAVVWGKNVSGLKNKTLSDNLNESYIHSVKISGLEPVSDYYYEIISSGFEFTNNNLPWKATTGPHIEKAVKSLILTSRVVTGSGLPANALVFLNIGGSSPISTTTGEDGVWSINIAESRNPTLEQPAQIEVGKTPIEIYVQAGLFGVSYGSTTLGSNYVVPPMKLGEVYLFNSNDFDGLNIVPSAEIKPGF